MADIISGSRTAVEEKDSERKPEPQTAKRDAGSAGEYPLVAAISSSHEEAASASILVGLCLDIHHPTLAARCLVRWSDAAGHTQEKWLPRLREIVPEKHDRVLLQQPANWFEPLVCGILDGLSAASAQEAEGKAGPTVNLASNEALHVLDAEGNPLLQIEKGKTGPVLRLLSEDLDIEVKGRLRIAARDLHFVANAGGVSIEAADDVEVKGEIIYLN
jgi:hypothetical protein